MNILLEKTARYRSTEFLCAIRILKHKGTLQIIRAVEAARQDEVTFKQSSRLSKNFEDYFRTQDLLSIERMHATIATRWRRIPT